MTSHDDIWRDLFDGLPTCGDNSCEVKRTRGPGTNAGCRCSERQLRRALRLAKKAIVDQEQRETEIVRSRLHELIWTISEAIHEALVAKRCTVADIFVRTTADRWQVTLGDGEVLASGEI